MNNQNFVDLKDKNKSLFTALCIILSVFLATLIISTIVGIQNKIKQGKYIGQEIEVKNTITVSGTGEIYAKPDLALTTFSVITEKETVKEAIEENTQNMNAIIDFIKSRGIEDKDLKTIGFNIYPRYEWHDKTEILPEPQGERVLVGYEVRQALQVKIRDMAKIGEIIEGATAAGANQIGDLRFTIDKEDEFKTRARKQAIDKAKVKAEEITSQLGVDLVRIINFNESTMVPRYYALEEKAFGAGGGEEAPQIEIGENKIEVGVSITYEIN